MSMSEEKIVEEKIVISKGKVKEYAKGLGMRMSGDCLEAVDAEVKKMVERAAERRKANNGSTIKPCDL